MITLAPELTAVIRPGVLVLEDIRNRVHESSLDARLAEAERQVRARRPAEATVVRAMYRAVGLDPTKRRPSSEALLRRVLRGESLPRINAAVDVGNWCSLEFQLPYGLYDLAAIDGPIAMRLGGAGEGYPGIGKDWVNVEARLALADTRGPFGNPSSDSARTQVTPSTTRLLAIVYAPAELDRLRLGHVLGMTATRLLEAVGGRETHRGII